MFTGTIRQAYTVLLGEQRIFGSILGNILDVLNYCLISAKMSTVHELLSEFLSSEKGLTDTKSLLTNSTGTDSPATSLLDALYLHLGRERCGGVPAGSPARTDVVMDQLAQKLELEKSKGSSSGSTSQEAGAEEKLSDSLVVRDLVHADGSKGKGVFASKGIRGPERLDLDGANISIDPDDLRDDDSESDDYAATALFSEESLITYFPNDHEKLGGDASCPEGGEERLGRFLMVHLNKSCTDAQQKVYMALHDCTSDAEEMKKTAGGAAKAFVLGLIRRFQTNAITLMDETAELSLSGDGPTLGRGIFPQIARVNHSCFPSCDVRTRVKKRSGERGAVEEGKVSTVPGSIVTGKDEETGELKVEKPPSNMKVLDFAKEPSLPVYEGFLIPQQGCRIRKGEEVTISYVDLKNSFEERNRVLASDYRFRLKKEGIVERWLGLVEVVLGLGPNREISEKLEDLDDFMEWAAHRVQQQEEEGGQGQGGEGETDEDEKSDKEAVAKNCCAADLMPKNPLGDLGSFELAPGQVERLRQRVWEEILNAEGEESAKVKRLIDLIVEEDDFRRAEIYKEDDFDFDFDF